MVAVAVMCGLFTGLCRSHARAWAPGARSCVAAVGICAAALLKERGQRRVDKRGDGDVDARLEVEGVDLVAQPGSDGGVLNGLDARAIDVPHSALPDVS